MSDFNDDFDPDDVADAIDEARTTAREEAAHDAWADRRERFGMGICRTGVCVSPCGPNGGCVR